MLLNIRFDTINNIELVSVKGYDEKPLYLGNNFIKFISLDLKGILNNKIINSLNEKNYKEILFTITTASADIIIPEIININSLIDTSSGLVIIKDIKKDLISVLNAYNKFKEITEFCYFNTEVKDTTPLQNYIYYLHKFKIEEVTLPRQTINSFGLKPVKVSNKLIKNSDILIMLKENSPYFYFNYECKSIDEYLTASFLQLIENNYNILKCQNCGKYFIPYRADTLYCDRVSPQDDSKTCKKYSAIKNWQDRIKDTTDWHGLYRKVYMSLQMKAKRNPNHKLSNQKFEDFKKEAKEWKKGIKEHKKTDKEFLCWLQSFRQK